MVFSRSSAAIGVGLLVAGAGCNDRDVKLRIPIGATEKTVSAQLVAEPGARYEMWAKFQIEPPRDDAPRYCHELRIDAVRGDETLARLRCYGFPHDPCTQVRKRSVGECRSDCVLKLDDAGPVELRATLANTGKRCEPGPAIGKRNVACGWEGDNCYQALTHPQTQIETYDVTVVKAAP